MSLATLNRDEQPLRCTGCSEAMHHDVDLARGKGWRVPWTPGEAVWCPQCWKPPQKRVPAAAPQPWDEPLW